MYQCGAVLIAFVVIKRLALLLKALEIKFPCQIKLPNCNKYKYKCKNNSKKDAPEEKLAADDKNNNKTKEKSNICDNENV